MEAKVKILFIDDDITFGRICTIILQEKGYEVFYQTTLNGAKACIAEAHPDIIVLDVEIGNQNGIEVAPEITVDRKSTRLNSSHASKSRMPSSA